MNRLLSLALSCLALAGAAQAQTAAAASSPVQVQAPRAAQDVRRDVSTVCPALHQQLPESLASTWHRVDRAGMARARFTLRGNKVVGFQALEGHRGHLRGLRDALQEVDCSSDHTQDQVFEIAVRFTDGTDASQRVALLTP
jgi:hypothetical protein